jgi:Lipopolysaccharide kinase (Kdo/WaaP) family
MLSIGWAPQKTLRALGYRQVRHAAITWTVQAQGVAFLQSMADWSSEALWNAGWPYLSKASHRVYLATGPTGRRYVVKDYALPKPQRSFLGATQSRARVEFYRTLQAHTKNFPTVLPLAYGEREEQRSSSIIVYPFLDSAVSLDWLYTPNCPPTITTRQRQHIEKTVGKLVRTFIDSSVRRFDGHLDHFLVSWEGEWAPRVWYVDFEKIRFTLCFLAWVRHRKRVRTLGKLLARLQWLNNSGSHVNRASMMRISQAYFHEHAPLARQKKLCQAVLRAAQAYWIQRRFQTRGSYVFQIFQLHGESGHNSPISPPDRPL